MKHKLLATSLLILALASTSVHADTLHWSGNGTTLGQAGTWNTTAAHFGTSTSGPFTTIWNNANSDSPYFDGVGTGTFVVTLGGPITMNGTLTTTVTPGTYNDYSFAGSQTLTFNPGSAVSGVCSYPGNKFTAPYAGTITKMGTGIMQFDNANGTVTKFIIKAGTVGFPNPSRAGKGPDVSDFFTLDGGAVEYIGETTVTMGRSVSLTANGGSITSYSSGATVTANKPITSTGAGRLSVTTCTLVLSSTDNAWTGPMTIASTVKLGASGVIPDTCYVTINSGKTLDLNGFDETIYDLTSSGTVTLGNKTLTIGYGGHTYSGVAGGTGGMIVKSGAGTTTFSGANTYTGGTTVNAGKFQVGNASALGTGKLTLAGGALCSSSTTAYTLSVPVDVTADVTLGDASNTGALTFQTGAWTLKSGDRQITAASTVTINSAIGNDGSAHALTKAGSGTLALGGANNYGGLTTVSAGTLEGKVAGSIAADVTVGASGILKLSSATAMASGATLTLATTPSASTVNLNFSGTQTINALSYGATPKAQGTWGSTTSTAEHKDSVFTSNGLLQVTTNPGGGDTTTTLDPIADVCAPAASSLTATVTGPSPTGSVEFFDGAVSLGTAALSGVTASKSVTLSVGTHATITAKYLGDDSNNQSTSDPQSATVGQPATVNAGPDQVVCGSSPATLAGSIGGSATSATWSGGAGTLTPDNTTLTATYTPTAGEIAAGSVTLTLTTDDPTGPCGAVNDSMTITFDVAPTITGQPANRSVCSGSPAAFSVTATGPGLNYSWAKKDNAGWGSSWSASGSGGTFRGASTDNDFGDPACTSFSSANDINSPSGNALGMWGGGGGGGIAATRTFSALSAGQVVSVDFDNGNVDNGVKAGFSLQTSAGADVLQFYFTGGGTKYLYNDGTETDTGIAFQRTGVRVQFVLTSASAYTLIVTPCGGTATKFYGAYSGTIEKLKLFNENTTGGNDYNVYFNNFLVGGYVDNADNYSGDFVGLLDKGDQAIASGNGASTYTTPVLSVGDSGTQYEVVVYSCGGALLSSAATVTVNALPTITLGASPVVCFATTSADLSYSATTESPDKYSIDFDAAAEVAGFVDVVDATLPASPITITVPGAAPAATYNGTLTLKNSTTGCVNAGDAITVTVNPAATVSAGADQTVCADNPTVTLAGSIGGAASSATWSGGAGTFTPDNTTLNATYLPTPTEITAGTVTLTLTTDDPAGPCGPVNDSMTITINPVATVDAGPDQTICATSQATLAGAFGGAASGATWSGAGTFAPNNTTLNATYTPTPAEILAGTATVTLTTDDPAGPCGTVSDSMVITINPAATVNAGADQTVCADSPTVTLAGLIGGAATSATWSGGAGTFTPDNTTLNATYLPTPTEVTAGTVTLTLTTDDPAGLCGPVNDSMTITINPIATVDAGPDQTVCASSPTVTLAGSIGGGASSATWSGGAGTFTPNNTTLNATYTPTPTEITAGTVTLTLTTDDPAGPCGAANDAMLITINPAATVDAGADQTVCYDSATVTLAGSIGGAAGSATWSGGAGTFTPDNTTLNATYTPTAGEITAGTVTLTLTTDDPAGPCGSVNDSMAITINAAPAIADQPTNLTVCASSPAIFSVGATGAGLTYQWQGSGDGGITFTNISDTATNASYTNLVTTVADSGYQYQVIVSGACSPGVTSAPPAVLTVDAPPTVNAGADQTVCADSPTVTLAGSIGGAAASATWSGGAGTFTPDNTALNATYLPTPTEVTAGTVTLTLTTDDPAGPCGAVNDSMVITINPAATVNAGADQTVCADSPTVTLAGSIGGAAASATWSGGAGTFTPDNTALNATYLPTPTEVTAGTVTLTLTTDDPAGPCGAVNDSMVITINPAATVNAGADQTVCASSPTVTLAGAIGGAATSATWSGGAGTFTPDNTTLNATYLPTATEVTAGTVTLTLTTDDPAGPCGAVNDSMVITINPAATVNAGADQTVCADSPTVTLAGSIGGAAASATWSGGAGTFTPDNTALNATYLPTPTEVTAGTVTLTLTTDDPAGPCGAVNDSMVITINPAATVNAGADQTVCADSPTVTLAGSIGGAAASATWSGGAGTFTPDNTALNATYLPTPTEVTAGTVTLTLTTDDPAGPCGAVNDSMVITINPAATVNAGADQTVCADSPTVTLAGSIGGAAASATWSGGAGTFTPDNTALNATYLPTPTEVTAGTVTLTLTTDDPAGPCGAVNDSMVITINPVATVNAGADQTVSAGSPTVTLAGSIGGAAASATWSGGAGTFNPDNVTLNAAYTPTAGEITAGTVTLTLTTDDPAGPCGVVSDSMTITITPAQESVTITSIIDNGNGTITINYSGGAGASFTLMRSTDLSLTRDSWTAVSPNQPASPGSFTITPVSGESYVIRSN